MNIIMLKIISVGCQAENYIKKCIESVLSQTYKDWEMTIILDPANDKTYDQAMDYECKNINVYKNRERRYAIGNISLAVKMMDCKDDDILIWIDCDDWMASEKSLEILMKYYNKKPELLLTHGSWRPYPDSKGKTNNATYTAADFQRGIRILTLGYWRGSHLKTMKYKLYKYINQDREFKWQNGNWLESSYDMSLMYPALEMAGINRIQFIPEILYIYNRETQYNDDKVNIRMQEKCANYLSKLPRYELLCLK